MRDWKIDELEEFIDEICTLYRYCSDKESCNLLRNIYVKIVEWVNEQRGWVRHSKGYLDRMKKEV